MIRFRWLVLLLTAAASALCISWLPGMQVDNSTESFLHPGDPSLIAYNEFRERFGRDDRVVLGIDPPRVFDAEFLTRLRALHEELERDVPYVEEVTSLLNARSTRGEGDRLIVADLMAVWPGDARAIAELERRVLANPLYRGFLISDDGTFTTVTVKPFTYSTLAPDGTDDLGGFEDDEGAAAAFLSEQESRDLVHGLRAVVARHQSEEFPIYMAGGPVMNITLNERMQRDVQLTMSAALGVIVLFLFLLFRRFSGVLLPTIVVVLALLATLGIMARLGIPLSVPVQILPAFLLVVGVCDAVHILVIFYRQMAAGRSRHDAIADALAHSGLAIAMTSLTTAGGLLSFSAAELAPISHLGIVAPIGIMLAFAYTVTLMPALLAILPIRPRALSRSQSASSFSQRFLSRMAEISTDHPWGVLGVTVGILVFAGIGFSQVHFSHDALRWFPSDEPIRVASDTIDRELHGISTLEIVLDTGHVNGLHDPETLKKLEEAMAYTLALQRPPIIVAKVVSIVDVIRETHQALNENRPAFYAVPEDRELIAQELLLFENSGSDDLEEVTDSRFQLARLTVRLPWVDAMVYPPYLDELQSGLQHIMGDGVTIQLTGLSEIFSRTFRAVIISMARSYLIALAIITPMLVLLVGNLKRGLAAMIPNLIPIYLVLAFMGSLDIPLDGSTLLVGGVILGLAVDDTIHFMHKFNRYLEETGDSRAAVRETLATTGTAMLYTSLVLTAGFCVFTLAYMKAAVEFGMLAAFATMVAFLADVLVAPALMVLLTRPRS